MRQVVARGPDDIIPRLGFHEHSPDVGIAVMPHSVSESPKQSRTGVTTLGVVSFLNARPLVDSLVGRPDAIVKPAVPAKLAAMMDRGACEVALLPIVDYWRSRDRLERISDACIASEGETLTVRVFSKVPPDKLVRLHADVHSHTSVILARAIWRELYDRRLDIHPYDADARHDDADATEAILLIGDKVVCDVPRGFGFQVDLGSAWQHLTGLPFVFAAWYGPRGGDHRALAETLEAARDAGVAHAERIAAEQAPIHGWPQALAVRYLRDIMRYRLTDAMRTAMDRFFQLIERDGLLR